MKSLFFPFEQIVNFLEFLWRRHWVSLLIIFSSICLLLYTFFNIESLYVFLGLTSIYLLVSLLRNIFKTKSRNNYSKNNSAFFFLYVVLIFLGIVYGFTTKYYDEELNIASYSEPFKFFSKEKAEIYSAEPQGNYHKIMDAVISTDSSYFKEGKPESSGGYENPNRVLLNPEGLGFVQEDIYKEGDKIREQLNYVSPLYMEKLHILYNKKSKYFKQLLKTNPTRYLSIGDNSKDLIKAIKSSRIAVGKTGSSTKILSSILLSEISNNKPNLDVTYIQNATFKDALVGIRKYNNKVRKGFDFDILFFMAGQPVDNIQILLAKSDSFGLIGIEPQIVDAINKSHSTQYRYTDFSVKTDSARYGTTGQFDKLPTLGSYSYLIANKKVKPYFINRFIKAVSNNKTSLKIDFFNFEETHKRAFEEKKKKIISSLLLSFSGGVALGTLILSFLFALISSIWHDKISNDLARIIKNIPDESTPEKERLPILQKEDFNELSNLNYDHSKETSLKYFTEYYEKFVNIKTELKIPYIKYYQIGLINDKLVSGMSALVIMRQKINQELDNGRLNSEHFNDLLVRVDSIMDKLRKGLFLRLCELISRDVQFGGINIDDQEVKIILQSYLTSNYLNFDDYKRLLLLNKEK